MNITSLSFVLFLIATFALYFALPKKIQWIVLLVVSLGFYVAGGLQHSIYILITASTIYLATIFLQKITLASKKYLKDNKETLSKEDKKAYKEKIKKRRQLVMLLALLGNIGLLCVFKYFHFALAQLNSILSAFGGREIKDTFQLIVPLGISFYTFQAVGYLLDVYWEKIEPEKNYFKVLLFVSFFPQITQGPISDFESLSTELFTPHDFNYKNYAWGFQRMLWGFFKKMLIANVLSPFVQDVFANYSSYTGITVLIGAFMYSVQIYADFSGYMDIMCGFCEMLGIRLTENFQRPYFSKSVAEYWRRWHMSLGTWFKNYIYFPIGMSTWSRKLAKSTRATMGKHFSDNFPATIALVIVWTATGLWHGASWAYISWGLVNGLFIIFSLWMEPVYAATKSKLRITDSNKAWRVFQVLRTFIVVTFIKVLPEVGTLSQGFGLWKQIFTNHSIPTSFKTLLPFVDLVNPINLINFLLMLCGVIAMFCISLRQRREPFRILFNKIPFALRLLILAIGIVIIFSFGTAASWGIGGFMYAQF